MLRNALSLVRDAIALSKQLRQQLQQPFGIDDYVIHALSEDKKGTAPSSTILMRILQSTQILKNWSIQKQMYMMVSST
jgi:hypothetical protein